MLRVRFSPSAWSAKNLFGTKILGERFPSGQREQTVNLPAYAFGGSNPPLSTSMIIMYDTKIDGESGNSSVGRARAFQARGRGFESRFPLQKSRVTGRNYSPATREVMSRTRCTSGEKRPCSSVGRALPW